MSRTLVIDCQILQTPAFDRGMGKYTLSLIKEFIKKNDETNNYKAIHIILSKNLENSKERIKHISQSLAGTGVHFTTLDLPTDLADNMLQKYESATRKLDEYMRTIESPDINFLITAPFFANFAAAFPASKEVKKFSIVYDLIPHKIWNLLRIFPDDIYFHHYKLFLEADGLFTISNAVKDDLVNLLGLPKEKIVSIDGAPFMRSSENAVSSWKPNDKKYLLMPSGPIVHKNNERAVRAFEKFNKLHNHEYTLYITSNFDEGTQEKLKSISKKVVFTGNISDEMLVGAYRQASAVLFPSLAEGLGMPVLEAALENIPVACSNIPVLSELSKDAFYQFDPTNIESISNSLQQAVAKSDWPKRIKAYKELRNKYTWGRSADILNTGLTTSRKLSSEHLKRLRLIIPRPNHDSPAAYLGELLYAQLTSTYEVSLSFSGEGMVNAPSYVAYLSTDENTRSDVTVKISNTLFGNLLFWKGRKAVLVSLTHHGKTEKITMFARRIFADKALQLKGWQYSGGQKKALGIAELTPYIFKNSQHLQGEA